MAVVFLPFIGPFSKLIMHLVPEQAEEKKFGPMYLDEHVLGTPSLALGQATREALRASDIVREMLMDSIERYFRATTPLPSRAIKNKDNLIDLLDRISGFISPGCRQFPSDEYHSPGAR